MARPARAPSTWSETAFAHLREVPPSRPSDESISGRQSKALVVLASTPFWQSPKLTPHCRPSKASPNGRF